MVLHLLQQVGHTCLLQVNQLVCRLMFKSEALSSELDASHCTVLAISGANGAVYLKVRTFRLAVPWHCAQFVFCRIAWHSFQLRTFVWAHSKEDSAQSLLICP